MRPCDLVLWNKSIVVEQPRCRRPRSYSGRLDQLASTLAMIYRIEHTFFVSDHQRIMWVQNNLKVSDNVHHWKLSSEEDRVVRSMLHYWWDHDEWWWWNEVPVSFHINQTPDRICRALMLAAIMTSAFPFWIEIATVSSNELVKVVRG